MRHPWVRRRWDKPTTLFALLLLTQALGRLWDYTMQVHGVDFYHYWLTARALREGSCNNIYSEEGRRLLGKRSFESIRAAGTPERERAAARDLYEIVQRRDPQLAHQFDTIEPTGTPFFYSCIALVTTDRYETDYRRFAALRLACYTVSIIVLARLLHYSPAGSILSAVVFMGAYEPFARSDLPFGNVNSIQMALLALFIYLQSFAERPRLDLLGGLLAGLMVMFKPNLVFVPLTALWIWSWMGQRAKLWHFVPGAAMGVALAFWMAACSFGTLRCWAQWPEAALRLTSTAPSVRISVNDGLAALLQEWTDRDLSRYLLAGATVAFLVLTGYSARRCRWGPALNPALESQQQAFLLIGASVLIFLLSSRVVWLHYYVLLVPFVLYCFRPQAADEGSSGGAALRFVLATTGLLLLTPLPALVRRTPSSEATAVLCVASSLIWAALWSAEVLAWSMPTSGWDKPGTPVAEGGTAAR